MNSRELARYLVLGGVISGIAAGAGARTSPLTSNSNNLSSAKTVATSTAPQQKISTHVKA